MLASVESASLLGVEGHAVRVEAHTSNGLPGYTIVGLPDTACRESRDRVRSALLSSGGPWPNRRTTVNLAPSGLRKVGAGLDLAMAVALAAAEEHVPVESVEGLAFLGELGLDGSLRPLLGMVPLAAACGGRPVVPAAVLAEARLVREDALGASSLGEVLAALRGDQPWPVVPEPSLQADRVVPPDLSDVLGQAVARAAPRWPRPAGTAS
ncbi:MAG: magnesium chelatase domain-containing protein [Microthrixaceae bacterium]